MNFSDALTSLKEGTKCARLHWLPKGRYIHIHLSNKVSQADFLEVFDRNQYGPWSPTHCDLLADDWEIIE
jgi:hypothetical protein